MLKVEKSIEYLFYLLVLLYFVGKVFKPITVIIDILFIYIIFKSKDTEYFKSFFQEYKQLIIAFLMFIGYLLFQSIFLEFRSYTFRFSLETILYIILVFAALYTFNDKVKIRNLIYASYIILAFLALDSFYQYFTGIDFFGKELIGGRITAWHDSPKVNLLMGQFFGLLVASVFILDGKEKRIAIFILIVSLFLFILSGNRSPLLALFSSLIIIGIISIYRKYILGLLGVITIIFALIVVTNPHLNNRYSTLLNPTESANTSHRIPLLLTGCEILKDNAAFGIGSYNYPRYHSEYYKDVKLNYNKKYYYEYFERHVPTHVHSVFIDQLISYGIIGFLMFLYILYQIYQNFLRNNEIGILASIGFLYCITPLQFGKAFTQDVWQFITYLGLIFLVLLSRYNQLDNKREEM